MIEGLLSVLTFFVGLIAGLCFFLAALFLCLLLVLGIYAAYDVLCSLIWR